MIIVSLIGGLGNQLFQYALGRTLAEKHQTELYLDVSGFQNYQLHRYSLQHFRIVEKFMPPDLERRLSWSRSRGRLSHWSYQVRRRFDPQRYPVTVSERGFRFDPSVLSRSPPVHLEGYWQSEQYFSSIAEILREELAVRSTASCRNQELAQLMTESESISLHVRRGDYASNPQTLAIHGVCSTEFYERALRHVRSFCSNPHVFIFSDDPEWCRANLNIELPTTYVDHNDAAHNYEDLRLMSSCRYNIIANSTFSWWGAWLNRHPARIVVAPARWFQTTERDDTDLIPPGWIRM